MSKVQKPTAISKSIIANFTIKSKPTESDDMQIVEKDDKAAAKAGDQVERNLIQAQSDFIRVFSIDDSTSNHAAGLDGMAASSTK